MQPGEPRRDPCNQKVQTQKGATGREGEERAGGRVGRCPSKDEAGIRAEVGGLRCLIREDLAGSCRRLSFSRVRGGNHQRFGCPSLCQGSSSQRRREPLTF